MNRRDRRRMRTFSRRTFLESAGAGAAVLAFSRSIFPQIGSPIAVTKYGKVRGYLDQNINVFKGIRYGADTAKRRFMAPLAPDAWAGVKDAIEYGASSPQQGRGGDKQSEDCLFLNVFTPALRDGGKRP